MSNYIILTDSSYDLPASMADDLGLAVLPLSVLIEGEIYKNYLDERELNIKEFYNILREKIHATTSAVNTTQYIEIMDPILAEGKDILALPFTSGLSATCSACLSAAEEMRAKYPERKIYVVDTLCASLGQGLLVYLCVQQQRAGKSIEEVRDFAEDIKLKICHWVAVDDLFFLKRGGRVSAASAVLGTTLSIKPIIHVNNEGKLIPVGKVRGRKASLKTLISKAQEQPVDLSDQTIFICHGDCEEDAMFVANGMKELGAKEVIINHIGPVIGAHAGPGTVAVFYVSDYR